MISGQPDAGALLGASLPHLVPERVVEVASAQAGCPVAAYVLDVEGAFALRLAGDVEQFEADHPPNDPGQLDHRGHRVEIDLFRGPGGRGRRRDRQDRDRHGRLRHHTRTYRGRRLSPGVGNFQVERIFQRQRSPISAES